LKHKNISILKCYTFKENTFTFNIGYKKCSTQVQIIYQPETTLCEQFHIRQELKKPFSMEFIRRLSTDVITALIFLKKNKVNHVLVDIGVIYIKDGNF
jgi:hypothetical protein